MLKDSTRITMIPKGNELMRQMIGAETSLYDAGNGEGVTR
jgi:hypothetical protein